ncbi:MAG TPA: hypothetical protein VLL97_15155 [Acidobacteriota bacterium]|nr:hypothetical protein [Acidobacteriota bacterium]
MATVIEETGLATRTEQSYELAPTAGAAEKQFEIQSAITVAKRFPRDEDAAFGRLMKATERTSFAECAGYSFPRGNSKVEGPSVNLARQAARAWGNMRYGLEVIRDDEDTRLIRGWAWDLETNLKVTAEDEFRKLIYRKAGGWVKPDERDLRELTNRRGAILVRGCILQILPRDLIEDAIEQCKATLRSQAAKDPDAARKKLIIAFSGINVTAEMLVASLGHPLSQCSPAEIAELRLVYRSIADGNSTWAEYANPREAESERGTINIADLKPGKEENRGHGQENLDRIAKLSEEQAKTPATAPESKAKQATGAKTNQPSAVPSAAKTPVSVDTASDPFGPDGKLFK